MVSLHALGTVEIVSGSPGFACRTTTPRPPKVRQVLALLMLRANYVVPAEALIAELWDTEPPRSATTTLQTYIYHLRKFLAAERIPGLEPEQVRTHLPGYALEVEVASLDVSMFRAAAARAHQHFAAGRHAEAIVAGQEALAQWRGPVLANVPRGRLLEAHATHLEEERLSVLEVHFDSAFALGRHREQIPQLRSLVATEVMNEGMHARLITALHASQRRGDALVAYQNLRRLLADELGLEPSPQVRRLQQDLLSAS